VCATTPPARSRCRCNAPSRPPEVRCCQGSSTTSSMSRITATWCGAGGRCMRRAWAAISAQETIHHVGPCSCGAAGLHRPTDELRRRFPHVTIIRPHTAQPHSGQVHLESGVAGALGERIEPGHHARDRPRSDCRQAAAHGPRRLRGRPRDDAHRDGSVDGWRCANLSELSRPRRGTSSRHGVEQDRRRPCGGSRAAAASMPRRACPRSRTPMPTRTSSCGRHWSAVAHRARTDGARWATPSENGDAAAARCEAGGREPDRAARCHPRAVSRSGDGAPKIPLSRLQRGTGRPWRAIAPLMRWGAPAPGIAMCHIGCQCGPP